ncbi:MAG: hypothetical protein IT170_11060, partial [Bryobacterales bacterium]|nr:hypothetical protein [Bryobacterales bacterium]
APLAPWESEEDQQPGEHPHADPAPAPQPHSTNHVESIPNPRPAGPIIVNATASRTTTPAPTELASAPHANTMPPSEIAPALAEYIPSDSLFPVYGSNPENPDKTPHPQSTANTMENQQYPSTQPVSSRPLEFCNNPETLHPAPSMEARATSHPAVYESEHAAAPIAVTSPADESLRTPALHASAVPSSSSAPAAPSAPSPTTPTAPSPAATLSQTWLSAHFLQQHESPQRFEALVNTHIRAYQPSTPAEELLVFRITQKAWMLRRLETWERVIADSQVARVRQKHPNTAAPACLALSLLEAKETAQTRFQDRIAKLRQEHEAALDRLEAKFHQRQQHREAYRQQAQSHHTATIRIPVQLSCSRSGA